MEKYLELLEELKKVGQQLIEEGTATREVETMDFHLKIAIEQVQEEMKENK